MISVTGSQLSVRPADKLNSATHRWNRVSGSQVSVSDPVFDPVSSFKMRVYPGIVSTE